MSTFTLPDGREMAYHFSATPSSLPVVLLANPLTASYRSWDRVAPVLEAAGYRVLRYDQPGHGGSGVPRDLASTTFALLADDAAALLKHLGIARLHAWVGVSMGASTGVYFVVRHPGVVARLVVCDTVSSSPVNAGAPDAFGPRVEAARSAGDMDAQVEGTLERWFGRDWLSADPDGEASRMRGLMRRTTVDGFETCIAALRSESYDLRPLLPQVGKGCDAALLVVGEKDADLPEKMQELRSGIEESMKSNDKQSKVDLVVLKNAGHASYIDGFNDFCKTVVEFLET